MVKNKNLTENSRHKLSILGPLMIPSNNLENKTLSDTEKFS